MTEEKIVGLANVDGELKHCTGVIRILEKTDNTAYISWKLLDLENRLVASKARWYKIENNNNTDKDIIELAIKNILTYRIGRKKVFSEISN